MRKKILAKFLEEGIDEKNTRLFYERMKKFCFEKKLEPLDDEVIRTTGQLFRIFFFSIENIKDDALKSHYVELKKSFFSSVEKSMEIFSHAIKIIKKYD
jgi:hypothetical protein